MQYQNVSVGQLIRRVSRFTVELAIDGVTTSVHMNNTGRNKEILVPGSLASVRYVNHPNRKTHYDLLAVNRQNRWINIDPRPPGAIPGLILRELRLMANHGLLKLKASH